MDYSLTYTCYEDDRFEMSVSFSAGEADEDSYKEIIVVFQSCYGTYLALNGEQISLLSNDGSIPDNAVWKFRFVRVKGGKYLYLSSPQNAYFHRAVQKLLNTYHPSYDDWNLKKLQLKWTKQQMKTVKDNAAPWGRLSVKCVKGEGPLLERKIWLKPEADGSIKPILMVFSNENLSEEYFWSVRVFESETKLQPHNSKSPPHRHSSVSLGNQQTANQERRGIRYPGLNTHELVANDSPSPVPTVNHERKTCTKKPVPSKNYGLNGSRDGAGSAGNVLHVTVEGNINKGKNQIIEGVNIQTGVKNEQHIFIKNEQKIFINFPNN